MLDGGYPICVGIDIPGAISLLRELSLSNPWVRYMAPTCTSRPQKDCNSPRSVWHRPPYLEAYS